MKHYRDIKVHPRAEVSPEASIGAGTVIWEAQVRAGAKIGENCILGRGVYIDTGVVIGNNVKIQNYVSIYRGVTLEDGVMCGPHCVFTNDKLPRAITVQGALKSASDWIVTPTLVRQGASLGANATIICGVTVGSWAMIGAGAVVSRDMPDYGLVWGNPARLHGFVCPDGTRLEKRKEDDGQILACCPSCGYEVIIASSLWQAIE